MFARLPYFSRTFHAPFATYHVLYLGIVKNFVMLLIARLAVSNREAADEAVAQVMPIEHPVHARHVLGARLQHMRLRTTPSCAAVNFLEHLAPMTIEEMQLWLESISPYLFHDMIEFGVPENLLVMWCESSHACEFEVPSTYGFATFFACPVRPSLQCT